MSKNISTIQGYQMSSPFSLLTS